MSGQPVRSATLTDSAQTDKRHLLLIRPVSLTSDSAEKYVGTVAEITGLDAYSVRQKLVGSALDILKTGHGAEQISRLRRMRSQLRAKGFAVALVSADFRLHTTVKTRAVQLEIASGRLSFLDTKSNIICSLAPGEPALVTIGSLDPAQYGCNKNLLKSLYGITPDGANALLEKLQDVSKARPALAVFPPDGARPFHIICSKFNFGSLGDRAKLAISQNFLELVKLLGENAQCEIIADFGTKALPIIPLAGKASNSANVLKKFLYYSQLINLAFADGLQEVPAAENYSGAPIPLLGALTSSPALTFSASARGAFAGQAMAPNPILDQNHDTDSKHRRTGTRIAESDLPLPPPPESYSGYSARWVGFKSFCTKLQILGPRPLALGLLILSAGGFYLWFSDGIDFGWALTPAGALLSLSALTMFQRKRMVEHTPTSKLRSLQMGTVEIIGEAKRKYALRAPHSLVTCVYYRYKVLKKEVRHTSQGVATEQWVVVDRGNSGPVPFYLDDGTGKALIDPDGAVISGLQTEEYYGSMAELFTGAALSSDRKVVESVIPEGARLYILGHARPIKNTAVDRRKEYRRRLKALKNSPEAMARYDTDGDGKVSFEEWAQARTDIENQLLAESLTADIKSDTAVVGKHPGRGLFFISDRQEPELLARYRLLVPILGALGFAITALGLIRLLG